MSHPFDVLELPSAGRLIFTPCPGLAEAALGEALDTLVAAGAQALVTLMPQSEQDKLGVVGLGEQAAERGLAWFHLPVSDEAVPQADFAAAWAIAAPRLLGRLEEGGSVAIHCRGGSGRTGLIAARLLIESGVAHDEAVAMVQALRPKAIQHPAHIEWLAQFKSA